MGLDQYGKANKDGEEEVELMYWRKHSSLQGFMEQLYRMKGGEAEEFNCVDMELNEGDLAMLEWAVKNGSLPETSGFFFGPGKDFDHEYVEDDIEFIKLARQHIDDGWTVTYSCWY